MNKKPLFDKFDKVYHISKDSEEYIILLSRVYSDDTIEYFVTGGMGDHYWISEDELTINKRYI